MKKLLNLFAGITLVATGASTVVACDNGSSSSKNPVSKVDQILHKITKTNVTIDAGLDADINNLTTKGAITRALADLNNLSDADIAAISYINPPTLIAAQAVEVTVTIDVPGEASKTIQIKVTLAGTLAQQVAAFKQKIPPNLSFDIAGGTSSSITDATNISNIQKALKDNSDLLGNPGTPGSTTSPPTGDFSKIAWDSLSIVGGGHLDPGVAKTVNASFTLDNGKSGADLEEQTDTISFKVTRAENNQEKANSIKTKITETNIALDNSSSKTLSGQTNNIKNALQTDNGLTDAEKNSIGLSDPSSSDFFDGQPKTIVATIMVGDKTATVNLTVTMARSFAEQVNNLKTKVENSVDSQTLYVSSIDTPSIDTSTDATKNAINRTLQTKSKNAITAKDIQHISYTGNLQDDTATTITGHIEYTDTTGANATATFSVSVLRATTDANKDQALVDKINDTNIDAGLVPDRSLGVAATQNHIKNAIKNDNGLTDAEANAIIYVNTDGRSAATSNLTLNDTVNLKANINFASGATTPAKTFDIQVYATKSATQEVERILNRLTLTINDRFAVDGYRVSFFVRSSFIGQRVQDSSQFQSEVSRDVASFNQNSLDSNDINSIRFSSAEALQANVALEVTAKIKLLNIERDYNFHIFSRLS